MKQDLIYIKNRRLLQEIKRGLPVTKNISLELLEKLAKASQSLTDTLQEIVKEKRQEVLADTQSGPWLTAEEAGKKLNLHPKTVGRYCREKKIKGKKVGKGWLIKDSDLDELSQF